MILSDHLLALLGAAGHMAANPFKTSKLLEMGNVDSGRGRGGLFSMDHREIGF
jgi:hypothetical protein